MVIGAKERICNKLALPTPKAARDALLCCQIKYATGLTHRRENRIYFCRTCDAWHLTSHPRIGARS